MTKEKFNALIHNVIENAEKIRAAHLTEKQRATFEKELKAEKQHRATMAAAAAILEKNANGETLTPAQIIFIKRLYQNSISHGTGKMAGVNSISTSVLLNARCAKNAAIPGSICAHCYAMRYAGFRPALRRKLEMNTLLYARYVVPVEWLPVINDLIFRFESFGDLNNAIQVENYFNIARKNSAVTFAQWTKNPDYIAAAIAAGNEKPENVIVVYSSILKNVCNNDITARYPFIDKIFTVYSPAYIAANNIDINCGARSCLGCQRCYNKNTEMYISEKLK